MGLVLDLLFGSIGGAYLIYARRQHSVPFLVAGVILIMYPYLVSNVFACVLIGMVVIATPFIVQHFS